jgi:multisubunit Na+/H+ antiporter MnhE subunit
MKTNLWFIIPFTALYLALTENIALNNIVVGLLISLLVIWLVRPPAVQVVWRGVPTAVVALAQYILILLWDLLLSGIQVAKLILQPEIKLQQGIIPIQTPPQAEIITALSSHAITLTPGELVLESDSDGVMYTHTLDVAASQNHAAAMEARRERLIAKMAIIKRQGAG